MAMTECVRGASAGIPNLANADTPSLQIGHGHRPVQQTRLVSSLSPLPLHPLNLLLPRPTLPFTHADTTYLSHPTGRATPSALARATPRRT